MDLASEIESLRQMATAELAARYEELFGKAPRVKSREHLWKRCAWKLQEQRFGGLSAVAKERLEALIAEIDLPLGERQRTVAGVLRGPQRPQAPAVGTVLTREWRGREIRVTVVDGGYAHEGIVYRSLSAVAQAITGAHWNGKLFFNLTTRKAK